jgi:pimeloyl-ACP methyl ester carboxylesterase
MTAPASIPLPLRLTASGVRGLHRVSLPLAARLTAALFCTPLPPKWVVQRKLARVPLPAQVQIGRVPFRDGAFTTYRWPAAQGAPRALLTHGWAGAARQLVRLANALAGAGWDVTAIDHVAHGASPGKRSNLPMFVQVIDYAAQHLGPLDVVVGHSMGAGAAAIALARGLAAQRFVSIASPTSFATVLAGFTRWLKLPDAVCAGTQAVLEARTGMRFAAMEARHNAPRLKLPVLVVHDAQDKTVPYANTQLLMEVLPNARLITTQGLGHNRILIDAQVIAQIVAFAQEKTSWVQVSCAF